MISPALSRIKTPPGTGTMRPPDATLSAWMKAGLPAARRANSRPPKPIPKVPQALPPAISGRNRLDPSSRFSAARCPPASSTATVSGLKPSSRPFSNALSTMIEACARVSDILFPASVGGLADQPGPTVEHRQDFVAICRRQAHHHPGDLLIAVPL